MGFPTFAWPCSRAVVCAWSLVQAAVRNPACACAGGRVLRHCVATAESSRYSVQFVTRDASGRMCVRPRHHWHTARTKTPRTSLRTLSRNERVFHRVFSHIRRHHSQSGEVIAVLLAQCSGRGVALRREYARTLRRQIGKASRESTKRESRSCFSVKKEGNRTGGRIYASLKRASERTAGEKRRSQPTQADTVRPETRSYVCSPRSHWKTVNAIEDTSRASRRWRTTGVPTIDERAWDYRKCE